MGHIHNVSVQFESRSQNFLRGGRLKGRESSSTEGASNLEGPWTYFPETFYSFWKMRDDRLLGPIRQVGRIKIKFEWDYSNRIFFWKLKKNFLFWCSKGELFKQQSRKWSWSISDPVTVNRENCYFFYYCNDWCTWQELGGNTGSLAVR